MTNQRFVRYCTCGAKWVASSAPPNVADELTAFFEQRHSGEGHAPTDARTAATARRKQEWGDF